MTDKKKPASLDEAVDMLIRDNLQDMGRIVTMIEKAESDRRAEGDFGGMVHHGLGRFIRNEWELWFNEPGDPLTAWFTANDLNHGDDRSGAIIEAFQEKVMGRAFDLDAYKARLKAHWLRYGDPAWGGIFPAPKSKAELYGEE